MIVPFTFARTPEVVFGAGTIAQLPELVLRCGQSALLVTGQRSFDGPAWETFLAVLARHEVRWEHVTIPGEPTPEVIDRAVLESAGRDIDVAVAWGGGSVVDAGKAISAMLCAEGSVADYLEGVGEKKPSGAKVPFIAVPTTAGTGSEATKNAVISQPGPGGFKKSLRHDNYVPDVALIDPELAMGCRRIVTAACGLDAITQLLESFVSTKASPLTDVLAWSGLEQAARSFVPACCDGRRDLAARTGMAQAALHSGITLANAGLGVVHGIAGPFGACHDIPHGMVCGMLLGPATRRTIEALRMSDKGASALEKYGAVGNLLAGENGSVEAGCESLVCMLEAWTAMAHIPTLTRLGITADDLPAIAEASDNKNNPAPLDAQQRLALLTERL